MISALDASGIRRLFLVPRKEEIDGIILTFYTLSVLKNPMSYDVG
jgi:hypothetical protein